MMAMARIIEKMSISRKVIGAVVFGYVLCRVFDQWFGKLVRSDAMHVVSKVEEIYGGMFLQMEHLAKQVAKSSQVLAKQCGRGDRRTKRARYSITPLEMHDQGIRRRVLPSTPLPLRPPRKDGPFDDGEKIEIEIDEFLF